MSEDKNDIKICATYITETNDLFILVKNIKTGYEVFMINLDSSNSQE